MCGISGIINRRAVSVAPALIEKMTDLIKHRGPNGFGYYFGDNFAFGHRRLAIIDLSDAGHQPMSYMDRYVITFNGEVYNYLELRAELLSAGYTFHSATDTEVIMAAYDYWGTDCVNRFNGMWAFAIYDVRKKLIFCSRDRFGIKPFYYSSSNERFVFGSEIKQLLLFEEKRQANHGILCDYLVSGLLDHTDETFFRNVMALPGGHTLTYCLSENTVSINRYYSIHLDPGLNALDEAGAVERYRQEFIRAVSFRLRSDVPVGTCLSGGLDSSSVASIASERYQGSSGCRFIGIHAKSSERQTDESAYAIMVAEAKRIDLRTITPTAEDFKEVLDEVFYTQEEPFGSPSIFMQYFVMRKAKAMGCTVMLDGQGGDETLLGYVRYYPAYLLSLPLSHVLRGFLQARKNSQLSVKQLLSYCLYFSSSALRIGRLKKRCWFIKAEYLGKFEWVKKAARSNLSISRLHEIEIFHLCLPQLLRYEDRNSMRHSVEARLPFLDYRLLETALSVNNRYKICNGWTKYLLRKAMEKVLPEQVAWRKNKLGFNAPDKTWLQAIEEEMACCIHKSAIIKRLTGGALNLKKVDSKMRWRLYAIAKWEAIYDVSF